MKNKLSFTERSCRLIDRCVNVDEKDEPQAICVRVQTELKEGLATLAASRQDNVTADTSHILIINRLMPITTEEIIASTAGDVFSHPNGRSSDPFRGITSVFSCLKMPVNEQNYYSKLPHKTINVQHTPPVYGSLER